jgi:hypothetical protein
MKLIGRRNDHPVRPVSGEEIGEARKPFRLKGLREFAADRRGIDDPGELGLRLRRDKLGVTPADQAGADNS